MVANNEKLIHFNYSYTTYRDNGLSANNHLINRKEHSKSFYKYIGSKNNLTFKDCLLLWNFSLFKELPLDKVVSFYFKLNNKLWKMEFADKLFIFLNNKYKNKKNNLVEKSQIYLTTNEKTLILNLRKIKYLLIPENSWTFNIFQKVKTIIK